MLLVHMPEEEAFWTFVHMMQGSQFSMRQLYLPGFPLLQQFFIILRRLLRTFLPTLYRHFEDECLDVAFFAAQWYMTLFVYQLPFGVAARVWDLFLSRGWVAIFQAALALLQWDSELLLTMSMEDSLLYLKEFHEGKHEEELIRRLLDVPLHEDDLRSAMLDA
jgi:TBC1 domain family member 10